MLKKFLILPILGLFGFTTMSYANFVSDCDITNVSYSPLPSSSVQIDFSQYMGNANSIYICYNSVSNQSSISSYQFDFNGVHCKNYTNINESFGGSCFNGDYTSCSISSFDYAYYVNSTPGFNPEVDCAMSWVDISNGGDDNGGGSSDSSVFPTIPSSFTSGITALVNNFGSTLVGWLPTIILVALGIYVIFALFRVVRNYAKSSFNG